MVRARRVSSKDSPRAGPLAPIGNSGGHQRLSGRKLSAAELLAGKAAKISSPLNLRSSSRRVGIISSFTTFIGPESKRMRARPSRVDLRSASRDRSQISHSLIPFAERQLSLQFIERDRFGWAHCHPQVSDRKRSCLAGPL